jgi:hypothetical protein
MNFHIVQVDKLERRQYGGNGGHRDVIAELICNLHAGTHVG